MSAVAASGSDFFSGRSFDRLGLTEAVVVVFPSVRVWVVDSLLGTLLASLAVSTCGVVVGVASCKPAGAGMIGASIIGLIAGVVA